jgi:RND family efflux transporter MFP subunit
MNAPDLSRLKIDRSAGPTPRSRKARAKWLWVLLVVVLAVGFAAWRYFKAPMAVETVTVTTAFPYQGVTLMNATGYVAAQRKASLASKATGRLVWLGVLEGSKVKEGEVVARLESNDVAATEEQATANVRQARANLEQGQAELVDAQANLKRTQELVDKKFQSAAVLDQAIARYRKAEAGIASMRAAIGVAQASERGAKVGVEQTLIRAPFDGVVLTKAANIGDVITPFSNAADSKGAVVTIADMSTLEVEADVSESNIGKVAVGTPCEIQLDAFPDMRFQGNVSRMVPTVDRSKASVMVKVKFKDLDPRILPDMSSKIAFLEHEMGSGQRVPLTVVNPQAVAERDGAKVLFVVDGERVRQVPVATAEKIGDAVVVSGVKAGDKVVLKPAERLHDGAVVKPAAK